MGICLYGNTSKNNYSQDILQYSNVNFELDEKYREDFENAFLSSSEIIFDNGVRIPKVSNEYDKFAINVYMNKNDKNIVSDTSVVLRVNYKDIMKRNFVLENYAAMLVKEGYARKYYDCKEKVFVRSELGKYFSFIIVGDKTVCYGMGYGTPNHIY